MVTSHTFEGGPKKRESAGDARRRVRKTRKIFEAISLFVQTWLGLCQDLDLDLD